MKKESRLLRLGIVGCGPIAQIAHFDACRKARNAQLHAICDVATDLRERMALVHQPRKVFADYAEMLADREIDAILIAVADQYHVPLALQAIEAGKHVLVEKPLGVDVEECERLCARVKEAGLILQVGNNRRFDPAIGFARQFICEELGQRMAFKAWYNDSIYRYTMTDNLQPIAERSALARVPEGNPRADKRRYFLLTHGSHLVDTARYLGGPLEAVRARLLERFGAYCWFVSVEFADGSFGHLDMTIAVRGDFEEGFQIYGENGSVNGKVYLPWYHKSSHVECFSAKDRQFHRPLGEDAYTYKLQIEAFADAVLHGKQMQGAGIEDGVAATRALVAIARSISTGERILLTQARGSV
jgi:predicted dehydrogenase